MFTHINRELSWKIYIESAQTYERLGDIPATLDFLQHAVLSSPDNLKWKVWLIASRSEYRRGRVREARRLVERCLLEVPQKQLSLALLEYAKHFELQDHPSALVRARQIMHSTKRLVGKGEWKVYFEAVMVEIRGGSFIEAESMVQESLKVHNATGRLWATLIQLQHARAQKKEDFEQAYKTFIRSLNEIPKSGEVWCEGARLHMSNHPENQYYDLDMAKRYLEFAIQFTPQYGDSFLELLKLCLMTGDMVFCEQVRQYCIHAEPNYGVLWFYFKDSVLDNAV